MLKMIRLNQLLPRFAGFKKNSFSLDLTSLQVAPATRAFLYTPICGFHTDMNELRDFCKKHNLILIQDLTQSFGGKWKNQPLHLYGSYSFYSLCDLKTLHTHRGGLVLTEDAGFKKYFSEVEKTWLQKPSFRYFLGFIVEDFISVVLLNRTVFNHIGIWILKTMNRLDIQLVERLTAGLGFKTRFFHVMKAFMASGTDWTSGQIPEEQKYTYTGFQAAIGLERLKKFDAIEEQRRRKIRLFYENLTLQKKVRKPHFTEDPDHVFWRAPLVVDDFLEFQAYLLSKKIDAARSNLPWLPRLVDPNLSVSGEEMKTNCINIPIYHYLSDEEVLQIAQEVNAYAR